MKTPQREHVVILCGEGISVEKVSQTATELRYIPTTIYRKPNNEEHQQLKLRSWLKGTGGLLVTSNLQFSGMEASTCVFITNNMTEETGARSGLLRATSRMVVISYTKNINLDEVKKRFVVLNLITIILNDEKKKRKEERREVEYERNPQ